MREATLSSRLLSAAEFVRQDAVFADIGTDHAYLPIFLLKSGRIKAAYASDINEGPLLRAAENARSAGLSDKMSLILCDGAAELCGRGITDYAVCGMGGELIASIIDRAPELHRHGVRLILGPNSRQGQLRSYLAENGFAILSESYTSDAGKYYLTLLAEYNGVRTSVDPVTAELGWVNTENANNDCRIGYLKGKLTACRVALKGKRRGGLECSFEEELLRALASELEKINR